MDDDLEVIRHQMEETRSSLADKLETLEGQVRDTVDVATEAVSTTVEAVQETVETVKETFDLRKQVERRPWVMMTGAVAAGFIAGRMLDSSPGAKMIPPAPTIMPPPPQGYQAPAPPAPSRAASEGPIASSVEKLKGLAIGSLMSVVRELVFRVAPSAIVSELAGVVDDLTTKLGGKPLRKTPDFTEPECEPEETSAPAESAPSEPIRSTEPPPPRVKHNGRGKRRRARI